MLVTGYKNSLTCLTELLSASIFQIKQVTHALFCAFVSLSNPLSLCLFLFVIWDIFALIFVADLYLVYKGGIRQTNWRQWLQWSYTWKVQYNNWKTNINRQIMTLAPRTGSQANRDGSLSFTQMSRISLAGVAIRNTSATSRTALIKLYIQWCAHSDNFNEELDY